MENGYCMNDGCFEGDRRGKIETGLGRYLIVTNREIPKPDQVTSSHIGVTSRQGSLFRLYHIEDRDAIEV